MRTVAGCLRPTPVNQLPILAGIAPPTIRREAAVLALTRKAAKDEDHILHLVISERPSPARLKSRRPFAEHAHRLLRSTPEDVSSRSWFSTRWNEEWRAAERSRLHSFINTPDHVPGQDLPRRQWTTYPNGCRKVRWGHEEVGPKIHLWMRMWCAKPVGATHHGRLHNAQATERREGLDRPGRSHPDLAGIYQPGNMTIDARKKKKKKEEATTRRNRQHIFEWQQMPYAVADRGWCYNENLEWILLRIVEWN